jgi:CPA1 family monovalent cation:H+ antiporter
LVATSLAGVRGAITLAGVLTLPLVMEDGSPFPTRDLAIFLAMGVILVSLLGASVLLPPVLRGLELPPEEAHEREEDEARRAATEAAMKAIQRAQHQMAAGHADAELYAEAATMSMEPYRQRADGVQMTEEDSERHRRIAEVERKLRLTGLKAERDTLFQLRRARRIEDGTFSRLVREIDLAEARYGT